MDDANKERELLGVASPEKDWPDMTEEEEAQFAGALSKQMERNEKKQQRNS